MYVEYDSVRDFFFLAPPAFLGAFADFLEGLGHVAGGCVFFRCVGVEGSPLERTHFRGVGEPLIFGDEYCDLARRRRAAKRGRKMIRRQKIAARPRPEMCARGLLQTSSTPKHHVWQGKGGRGKGKAKSSGSSSSASKAGLSSRWRASTATSARASTPRASASVPVSTWAPSSSTSAPRSSSSRARRARQQEDAHRAAPHPARRPQRRGAQQAPGLGHDRVRRCSPEHPRHASPKSRRPRSKRLAC